MNTLSQPSLEGAQPLGSNSGTDNKVISCLRKHMNARIVGQERFVDRLLLALFADIKLGGEKWNIK